GCLLNDLFVARLELNLRIAIHFARNYPAVGRVVAGVQANLKARDRLAQTCRGRIENNSCPTEPVVQSLVREHQAIERNLRLHPTPPVFPLRSTQLENVGKISVQLD